MKLMFMYRNKRIACTVYIGENTYGVRMFQGGAKKPKVLPPTPALLTIHMRRRRGNFANICVLMTALIVLATGVIGGIYLYKHMAERVSGGQGFIQDQIIASHTCFGGHMDVNC